MILAELTSSFCEIGDHILEVRPNEMERHFRFREGERLHIVHREPAGDHSWAFAKMWRVRSQFDQPVASVFHDRRRQAPAVVIRVDQPQPLAVGEAAFRRVHR